MFVERLRGCNNLVRRRKVVTYALRYGGLIDWTVEQANKVCSVFDSMLSCNSASYAPSPIFSHFGTTI